MATRDLRTMAEIAALAGFAENEPVNLDTFDGFVDRYVVDEDVFCCVEKEPGQLCRHAHRKGFAVKTKGGSVTIIGGHCAETKFESNENFSSQRALFENKRRFLERLGDLHDRVSAMDESIASIRSAEKDLAETESLVIRVRDGLPAGIFKQLAEAGSGWLNVSAHGVRKRPGEDDEGRPIIERTLTEVSVGRLPGSIAFGEGFTEGKLRKLHEIERALSKAANLEEDASPKIIGVLLEAINRLPNLTRSIQSSLAQLRDFFKADLTPICFLSSRHEERIRALKFAADAADSPVGKDAARGWIEQRHLKLAKELGFDSIKVM